MNSSEKLEAVNQRIREACERSSRSFDEVTLVGVSKKKTAADINELHSPGLINFAENYLQEALEKIPSIPRSSMTYHFIGHLQSNKAKAVVENFDLIHSVDRIKLARTINQRASEIGKISNILIQVNIAAEESKSGFAPSEILAQIEELNSLENLSLCGLMRFPPLEEPGKSREYFKKSKSLFEEIKVKLKSSRKEVFNTLSMGTTSDFEVAIEEGSTMVRVGTALFGERS